MLPRANNNNNVSEDTDWVYKEFLPFPLNPAFFPSLRLKDFFLGLDSIVSNQTAKQNNNIMKCH